MPQRAILIGRRKGRRRKSKLQVIRIYTDCGSYSRNVFVFEAGRFIVLWETYTPETQWTVYSDRKFHKAAPLCIRVWLLPPADRSSSSCSGSARATTLKPNYITRKHFPYTYDRFLWYIRHIHRSDILCLSKRPSVCGNPDIGEGIRFNQRRIVATIDRTTSDGYTVVASCLRRTRTEILKSLIEDLSRRVVRSAYFHTIGDLYRAEDKQDYPLDELDFEFSGWKTENIKAYWDICKKSSDTC